MTRPALLLLTLTTLPVGVWAQFSPETFYAAFPGVPGWAWVAGDGPLNVHLIRDIGGLHLALGSVTLTALLRPDLAHPRVAGLAALLFTAPHLTYHAAHLNTPDSAASRAASLGDIGLMVLAAASLLRPRRGQL